MRSLTTWSTVAVLAALGSGCVGTYPPGKAVHITVFVYPAPEARGGCGVVTIPQHAFARQGGDVVWDISSDACSAAGEVTVDIDPKVVEMGEKDRKQKKGKVKGSPGTYKYKVALGSGFVEDPRIEIW